MAYICNDTLQVVFDYVVLYGCCRVLVTQYHSCGGAIEDFGTSLS